MSSEFRFSLKIESIKYVKKTENLHLIENFDESSILAIVTPNLEKEGLNVVTDSLSYTFIDGCLHVNGFATQISNTPDLLFANFQ